MPSEPDTIAVILPQRVADPHGTLRLAADTYRRAPEEAGCPTLVIDLNQLRQTDGEALGAPQVRGIFSGGGWITTVQVATPRGSEPLRLPAGRGKVRLSHWAPRHPGPVEPRTVWPTPVQTGSAKGRWCWIRDSHRSPARRGADDRPRAALAGPPWVQRSSQCRAGLQRGGGLRLCCRQLTTRGVDRRRENRRYQGQTAIRFKAAASSTAVRATAPTLIV